MHKCLEKTDQLIEIIKTLRSKDGCPWDKRQTIETLEKYVSEESGELLEAISSGNPEHVCEELGDLFYLILMISEIAEEKKLFNFTDVVTGISEKLIRRHPHVFEKKTSLTEEELRHQWEQIKASEKQS